MTTKRPTKLYKISEQGKIMGVCAGLADYFDINLTAVRFMTFLLALFTGFWFVLLIYFMLGFILDNKPADLYTDAKEEEFWKQTRSDPSYSASEMRQRFRDIERRTTQMEAYITSKRFKLERELRGLQE